MTDDRERKIVELVACFPAGAAISDLEAELDLHRRTIQRHLKKFVEEGGLHRTSRGPSTRYFVPPPPTEDAPLPRSTIAIQSLATRMDGAVRANPQKPTSFQHAASKNPPLSSTPTLKSVIA